MRGSEPPCTFTTQPRIGSPRATWGITDGNPVHDSVREIAAMTGVDFSLDVTINRDMRITAAYAGEMFQVHAGRLRGGAENGDAARG